MHDEVWEAQSVWDGWVELKASGHTWFANKVPGLDDVTGYDGVLALVAVGAV